MQPMLRSWEPVTMIGDGCVLVISVASLLNATILNSIKSVLLAYLTKTERPNKLLSA